MSAEEVPTTELQSSTAHIASPSMGELDNLRQCLPELVAAGQWMCYVEEPRPGKFSKSGRPKMGKAPRSARNGYKADKLDPAKRSGFEAARDRAERLSKQQGGRAGVGFVFTSDTPWTAIDIDGAWEDGALTPLAERVLDLLPDAYTEISPSGEGLHVIVRGKPTKDYNQQRSGLELYGHKGFVTITGEIYGGRKELRDGQAAIDKLEAFLNEDKERKAGSTQEDEQQGLAVGVVAPVLLSDDTELLSLARSSRQAARFNELWGGGGSDDASSGDLALCGMLAFWTGRDAGWMDRLFRSSGRMRDKWDEPHSSDGRTYGEMTLERAVAGCSEVYSGRKSGRAAARVNTGERTGAGAEETRPVAPRRVTIPAAERSLDRDTERANAERLAEHHGHEVCYSRGLGWLTFDGRRWAADEARAKWLASKLGQYVEEEAVELWAQAGKVEGNERKALEEAAKRLRKWRRQSGQFGTVTGTLGLADSMLGIDEALLDTHDGLLNVLNGTLELATGELRPHNPDDLLTQVAPVVWDAGAECPTWERVIAEVMPDPDKRRFLQKWMGYCLSGYTDEAAMVFAFGGGSNGKTTVFEEVLLRLLGDGYGRVAAPNILTASKTERHTTERAELRGSRFVLSSESESGQVFSSQALKLMIGVKSLKGRLMRQDNVTFPVRFKITLMSNHLPHVTDNSDGFWRRVRLLIFDQTFPVDPSIGERLTQEMSGILRWCVEGFQAWRAEGLGIPATIREDTDEYRRSRDTVALFAEARLVKGDKDNVIMPSAMFLDYGVWCDAERYEAIKHPGEFKAELERLGYSYSRSGGKRRWEGVWFNEGPKQ